MSTYRMSIASPELALNGPVTTPGLVEEHAATVTEVDNTSHEGPILRERMVVGGFIAGVGTSGTPQSTEERMQQIGNAKRDGLNYATP